MISVAAARGMAESFMDQDLKWLSRHLPSDGTVDVSHQRAVQLEELIKSLPREQLPFTVGLFGNWGAGKTTVLATLAHRLGPDPTTRVVYFNAWKYASFMDPTSALVHKVLRCLV